MANIFFVDGDLAAQLVDTAVSDLEQIKNVMENGAQKVPFLKCLLK
jgi:hypothetical protein